MKHVLFATCLAFGIFCICFCKKEKQPGTRVQAGAESAVAWQECVEFQDYGLTVCFIDASEYRCPCNADCFWEGAVDFTLTIKGAGIDTTVIMTTNSYLRPAAVIGNTTIALTEESGLSCDDYGVYEKYKPVIALSN